MQYDKNTKFVIKGFDYDFVQSVVKYTNNNQKCSFSCVNDSTNLQVIVEDISFDNFSSSYYLGTHFAFSLKKKAIYLPFQSFVKLFHNTPFPDYQLAETTVMINNLNAFLDAVEHVKNHLNIDINWTSIFSGDGSMFATIKANKCSHFSIFYLGYMIYNFEKKYIYNKY
jgi:hypothetical protein